MKRINPNLLKLAELTYNPELKVDSSIFEEQKELIKPTQVQANIDLENTIKIPETDIVISKTELFRGKNWEKTHYELSENSLFMPNPSLFMNYFLKVKDASEGKITLRDGLGNLLPKNEVQDLWKYLTTDFNKGCWTWLDALFKKENSGWHIETDHRVENDELVAGTKELLEKYIEEDCYVDLQFNKQGLPTKKSKKQGYKQGKNIHFWYPRNGTVAGFVAVSDVANLYCYRNPDNSYSALGVFACARNFSDPDYIYVPSIGIKVAKEKSLHGKNWHQTHKELQKNNQKMLTPYESIEFIKYLKENPQISDSKKILDEILTVRSPIRAEWLDAYFEKKSNGLYILTDNRTKAQKLDSNSLMKDKIPGIDLDYYIKNATSQGLPPKNISDGSFYYWHPRGDHVAWFFADSVRANLYCYRYPDYSNSALGVRAAKI